MPITINILNGPLEGLRGHLSDGQTLRVGRSHDVELSVMDPVMSRQHFQVSCLKDRCLLRDLDSRNGTRLNGLLVQSVAELADGDQIDAGCTTFKIFVRPSPGRRARRAEPPQRVAPEVANQTTWEAEDP